MLISPPCAGFFVRTPLQEAIGDIVLGQVAPLSEFELIRALQQPPYELLNKQALQGSLNLFQTHFLVFHCLYRLRNEWQQTGLGLLRIEPLAIQLLSIASASSADTHANHTHLVDDDPLAAYYLDLSNFSSTGAHDVEQLLERFWQRFTHSDRTSSAAQITTAQQAQALAVIGLASMPENLVQLKRQYRSQLHVCHPDKGGSNQAVQEVQRAYQVLRKVLQCGVIRPPTCE